jgi:hypothetical protein
MNTYRFSSNRVRVTYDDVLEVWRNPVLSKTPRMVCTTPLSQVQINCYYGQFLRTKCGNFGESDIGTGAARFAEIVRLPLLDWQRADEIRKSPYGLRIETIILEKQVRAIVRDSSGIVYPFSSITLAESGKLITRIRSSIIGVIPEMYRDSVRVILDMGNDG